MGVREIQWQTYGQTVLHPISIVLTVAMCVVIFRCRRSYAVVPIAVLTCLMPHVQRLVIAGLDFPVIRILLIAGWVRVLARGEHRGLSRGLHSLDYAFILWLVCGTLFRTLRDMSTSALIYRFGYDLDAFGTYFLLRCLMRGPGDVIAALRAFGGVAVVVALLMSLEYATAWNPFSILGGTPAAVTVRDGRLRCEGAFGHPILAGSFGASMLPLMVSLYLVDRRRRWLPVAGAVAATVITVTTSSSGPVLSYLMGVLCWGFWGLRYYLSPIRWALAGAVVFVHLIREKPVWHLIGRLSELIGGTGYHRVYLIDNAVEHFPEWWLRGTRGTAYWGWGLQDITNFYVAQGVNGGLATLLAFLGVIVFALRRVGQSMALARRSRDLPRAQRRGLELLAWGIGVSLVTDLMSWISVSFTGKVLIYYFFQLALIATLPVVQPARKGQARRSGLRRKEPLPATLARVR